MGAPKSKKSVHGRVSSTLERLEQLVGEHGLADIEHESSPETVEDSVRNLKKRVPAKTKPSSRG
ncbi:hypothetical protein [Magnetospirillum aberrantis]|uniref:Uncharacterized protein n=1 Tax=Magnetospirillum aberrantis SpK TaxID=908842 RepID=A0A7C9UY18_9PROT|nr:hypothetical protein [Magnetospirillum aberrantis]NFV79491.1 hypothetical protein [Magnetospirillum aberrantis SpK]